MHDDADRPRAYLFTWNPRKWHWEDLATAAVTVEQRGRLAEDWSCGRTERIKPGDRFFLLKQGADRASRPARPSKKAGSAKKPVGRKK